MADQTNIEWCDSTFNPWIGCTRVSTAASGGGGCDNCYAAVSTPARAMRVAWGSGEPRHRTADSTWAQPSRWNDQHAEFFAAHGRRRRVFCASLADVFDNEVDPAWRADLFFLIEQTPHLDWLLLTKRVGNVSRMVQEASELLARVHRPLEWPLPNVWLGATIVNQEEADRDIPKLLAIPARVRFLSMEPLLGPVDLTEGGHGWLNVDELADGRRTRLHWIIVGGESGHHARPMHPDWARSLRDQCAAAGIPFLMKQWGEWMPIGQQGEGDGPGCSDFPGYANAQRCVLQLDGEVRDAWPAGAMLMRRVGKKAAGRLLDGVTHDGFPEVT